MEKEKDTKLEEIDFHYLKTHSYRTYHVDGIFGGLTPRGNLYMELFVERGPTPTLIRNKLTKSGKVGDEVIREGKTGFIREIECGLMMDIETAKVIRGWLNTKIEDFEKLVDKGKKE